MSVYLVSGLFALGGVALAGLFAEIRAARDGRARQTSELTSLKRQTYSKAIDQVELVSSKVARWAGADDKERDERLRDFWDELTLAYQIKSQILLTAQTSEPADTMTTVLGIYRKAVEDDERKLPKPREQVNEMIRRFRIDLGLLP